MPNPRLAFAAAALATACSTPPASADPAAAPRGMIDLTEAVVVFNHRPAVPYGALPAVHNFYERVERQGGRLSGIQEAWPATARRPVIAAGLRSEAKSWAGPLADRVARKPGANAPEGFTIVT